MANYNKRYCPPGFMLLKDAAEYLELSPMVVLRLAKKHNWRRIPKTDNGTKPFARADVEAYDELRKAEAAAALERKPDEQE